MDIVNNLEQILNFVNYNIKLRVLKYYKDNGNNSRYSNLYETYLKNSNLIFENNQYKLMPEEADKIENSLGEIKPSIISFLNLLDNCRENNNYDTTFSMGKKIVFYTQII